MARRFRRWPGIATTLIAALACAAALRAWWPRDPAAETLVVSSTAGGRVALASGACQIVRVSDGNTLLVTQQQDQSGSAAHRFHVRLLGVRLPEGSTSQAIPLADIARLAPPGPARIELDKRRAATDGAWLAYVYVGETLVNAAILRAGDGSYEGYPADSAAIGRQLRQAQDEARRNRRGIWSVR